MRVECGTCKKIHWVDDKQFADSEGDLVLRCKNCDSPITVLKEHGDQDTSVGTSRVKKDFSGSLRVMGVPDVIQMCHVGLKSGMLLLQSDRGEIAIYFKEGNITYVRAKDDREGMAYYLFKLGRIELSDLSRVTRETQSSGLPQEQSVQKVLKWGAEEFQMCMDTYMRDLITGTFSWSDGTFAFSEAAEVSRPAGELVVDTLDLIFEGVRTIQEWDLLRRTLPDSNLILQMRGESQKKMERIHLLRDEREVVGLIDGKRTLGDICALAPCGDFAAYRAMYAFLAAGLIRKISSKSESATAPEEKVARPGGIHSRLIRREGGRAVQTIPAGSRTITFGRSLSAEVYVGSDRASRRHAQVMVRDGELMVRDLGSTNGTFVNGKRVFREKLHHGDILVVGDVEFEVQG